ncbi:alpha/beta hydrolase [Cellulomonas sp. NTE-D12]|uniref:alpha/beta hydrolase n=1 Tax=Cellulomonas sp. NTE-D12 TaxID=2962632 RepID=UPI0030818DB4|nr:alpha/beta hydrolase [Cellulomonas sp. NTE-D12]
MADDDVTSEVTDVLGEPWLARTIPLRPDGVTARTGIPPVATLVHRDEPPRRRAVLYVHGFVDYFFHPHVAAALAEHGYDLYALDLRDYGRSIRPGRPPDDVTDLGLYSEEIDTAVRMLRPRYERLVLLGHSTGGLITALWADARRGLGLVDALVLNSPWLDLRGSWAQQHLLTPVLDVVGRVAPTAVVARLDPEYGKALHSATGGEWDYDLAWKNSDFPVTAGFIRTVRRGHARVARGLHVDVPVLVLRSDRSGPNKGWHDELVTTDSVLDVEQIAARAPLLGDDVTLVTVAGGAHDLALSPAPAREQYLREVTDFLAARLPESEPSDPAPSATAPATARPAPTATAPLPPPPAAA